MPSSPESAREQLHTWQATQPGNFFTADLGLQRSLEFLWGTADYKQRVARLYQFGKQVATELDAAATRLAAHPPVFHLHDPFGRVLGQVEYHPEHHWLAQQLHQAGLTTLAGTPGQNLLAATLFYLSSQIGEAGQHGSLAATVGVIKLLQNAAAPSLRDQFLPPLLDPTQTSPLRGAFWLSEIQGGTNLGSNSTFAYQDEEAWVLTGEKWLAANPTADLAIVTARVAGQGDGLEGLGLFLLPRTRPDGSPNGIHIHQSLPTLGANNQAIASLYLQDALVYPLGSLEQGYGSLNHYARPTLQLYHALATIGHCRRAYITAWRYAEHRTLADVPLIHLLLVQDTLTQMRSDVSAMLSGTLRLVRMLDEHQTGEAQADTAAILRLGIPLNKFRASILAQELLSQGLDMLGGNGLREDFSPLPRLLRDTLALNAWEGSANALLTHMHHEMRQERIHEPFLRLIRHLLQPSPFEELRRQALAQLSEMEQTLTDLLAMDELSASVPMRPLLGRLMDLFYTACLAVEGAWEYLRKDDRTKQRLAEFFCQRRILRREAKDIPDYAHQISKLCTDIRPGKIDWGRDQELRTQMGDWAE
ncbi:MAG: acyl-CoA dehydrogenase family protein [Candidatus Promineifilaceae bacterium]